MDERSTPDEEIQLSVSDTPVIAHLGLDADLDRLTVIEYGLVWDGQPSTQQLGLEQDDRILFMLREADLESPVVGFMVDRLHEFDPRQIEDFAVWEGPRFKVPVLGLLDASVGEVILAAQARYQGEESTTDVAYFDLAVAAGAEEDRDTAEGFWRMALEAGDMKAHFGLGYTLCDLGRHREAYNHLRVYTELTPHNAWAWCWLGQVCEEMSEAAEAKSAYRRAIDCEAECGFETNAAEFLSALAEKERGAP